MEAVEAVEVAAAVIAEAADAEIAVVVVALGVAADVVGAATFVEDAVVTLVEAAACPSVTVEEERLAAAVAVVVPQRCSGKDRSGSPTLAAVPGAPTNSVGLQA